ncbi:MAG: hypothetical protein KGI33_00005 [Thaumarchaeota archaeon]|nr:hypothetical protein [Nitrososphaerota archaeon]
MILDLVLVSMTLAVPVLIGAFKENSTNETVHLLAKALGPATGIYPLCYLCYILLPHAGIPVGLVLGHPDWGTIILIIFGVFSYFLSVPFVIFGGIIGREVYEPRNAEHKAAFTALSILEPRLLEHASRLENKLNHLLEDKVGSYMKRLDNIAKQMISGFNDLARACIQDSDSAKALISVAERSQKTQTLLEKNTESLSNIVVSFVVVLDHLREDQKILEARIEALGAAKEVKEEDEGLTETKLTPLDGRASRTTGIEMQHEMARYLEGRGFEVTESNGPGQADYIIRYDDIVAIGSNKAYTLTDEPKRMQRRISAKDVEPELVLARKLEVPMVLFVTNIRNGRRWAQIVKVEELAEWQGVSTPVIMAKDDEASGRRLEEEFASVLASFGVVA